MKRQSLSIVLGVFTLLLFFNISSLAEIRENSFSLTPQMGGYVFEGNQDIRNVKNGITYGLGVGYNFSENFGAEFVYDTLDARTRSTKENVDGYLVHLDALYHFRFDSERIPIPYIERLTPYIAAGIGMINLDPSYLNVDNSFLVNYGVGLKFFLTDYLALRGDVRHVLTLDEMYNNLLYTGGLEFVFGGVKKVKTPPPPPPPPPDSDGDGVVDSIDKCPNTPAGISVDSVGCPLDGDLDGVPDYLDKCPDTLKDLKVDAGGCPILLKDHDKIDLEIEFDTNKSDIKPQYFDEIKKVADFMATYPEIKAVIEGHTDSVGKDDYNKKLSQRRANSVRDYLLANFNINPNRISTIGFGEDQPIASNDTPEGRSQNRRIQAMILVETETYEKR